MLQTLREVPVITEVKNMGDAVFEGVEVEEGKLEKLKVEELREKHREEQGAYREGRRNFAFSKARFLEEKHNPKSLVNEDMSVLAKTLKNKGEISYELLNNVMNGLLDDKDNIKKFLKVDGALQALLRLLSGQNEKFQLLTAQCICNLALGDEKESLQVLKASESYLMAHLSGRNCYVAEACLIALGNLSRQSAKNIELLKNQGFFTKVINILNNGDPNLEAAAVYALSLLVYHSFDVLSPEDVETCLVAVLRIFKDRIFSVAFLLSILSSCKYLYSHFMSNQIHSKATEYLLISLKEGEKEALYFLRIVSNLINEESGTVAKDLIENHSCTLQECITLLLQSDKKYLRKECLGLIGNLVNHSTEPIRVYGIQIIMEKFCLFCNLNLKKFVSSSDNVIS